MIKTRNIQPIDLTTFHFSFEQATTDEYADLMNQHAHSIEAFFKQFKPIIPSKPMEYEINNELHTLDELKNIIVDTLIDPDINTANVELITLILNELTLRKTKELIDWREITSAQELLKNNFPLPSLKTYYTYNIDVKNQSKFFLSNPSDQQAKIDFQCGLLAFLMQSKSNRATQFIVTDPTEYNVLKENIIDVLTREVQQNNRNEFISIINDIKSIDLDQKNTFTSWLVGLNYEANSVNRYIHHEINKQNNFKLTFDVTPNEKTRLEPGVISFINIEKLNDTSNDEIKEELKFIDKLSARMQTLKIKSLKHIRKADIANNNASSFGFSRKTNDDKTLRLANIKFNHASYNAGRLINQIKRIINKYDSAIETSNNYKSKKRSYLVANRRNPDDINVRGVMRKKKYRPDIHIYLDTSGSVRSEQYEQIIKILIQLAKKLDVDLYFTSFSHIISQPARLSLKGKSTNKIYHILNYIPKVSGGTEYEQVWQSIDKLSKQRKRRANADTINFIITDFEYRLRASYTPQTSNASTRNTFYLPLFAPKKSNYQHLLEQASKFATDMYNNGDHTIKQRIII